MIGKPCKCAKPIVGTKPSGQTWCRLCGGVLLARLPKPTRP